ncbi:MAG: nucleotidyltransferase domain-containing protein [Nitrospirae bacterium]|nr:nucleotidyltransferase domain-containing protein [Nitrospirota bacterium]
MANTLTKRSVDDIVRAYARKLEESHIGVWRMYLFGSQVKGTATPDSDIDIAVFLDRDDIDGFNEQVELMKLRWDIDLSIEPHAFARTDFDETNPFIREIITTGERII